MTDLMQRYLSAQLAGDRASALRVVLEDGPARGLTPPELHLDVIAAAQFEIGRLWQMNRVTIAQEHLATAISQLALAQLYSQLPREKRCEKRVLLACVEGELHDMAPRIAADFLEMAGFDVRFLGASVPTASLVAMAAADRADVIALSATMTFHLPSLRGAIDALREELGDRVPIIAGGHALIGIPTLEPAVNTHIAGGTARDLVTLTRKVAGCTP